MLAAALFLVAAEAPAEDDARWEALKARIEAALRKERRASAELLRLLDETKQLMPW